MTTQVLTRRQTEDRYSDACLSKDDCCVRCGPVGANPDGAALHLTEHGGCSNVEVIHRILLMDLLCRRSREKGLLEII